MSKKNVNDYSRFEKIDDVNDNVNENEGAPDSLHAKWMETMAKAHSHKDRGNQLFKESSLKLAKESYEDGLLVMDDLKSVKTIESLPNKSMQDDVRSLVVSFYSNLCMIAIKEESWFRALTNANKALELDPANVKCLFRRAVANGKLSQHDEAVSDLHKLLSLEPSNSSAKKELSEALKAQKDVKKKEQASFGKIFSKGTSLYDDKEKERNDRLKRQEEERLKDEADWKLSNELKISEGLPELSFEDWKKEKKEKEEEENKKNDAAKVPPKIQTPTKSKSKRITPKSEPDCEELYDEEEKKILDETKAKGYCYFKETSAKMEKREFTPKTISTTPSPSTMSTDDTPDTPHTSHTPTQPNTNGGIGTSSWNHAGTWEERDMTETAKQKLKEMCLSIRDMETSPDESDVSVQGTISSVNKLEGEAQIVLTRGKKRHLYDFNLKLDFEIAVAKRDFASIEDKKTQNDDPKNTPDIKRTYKGSLLYNEVAPQSTLESTIKWKKNPVGIAHESHLKIAIQKLHQQVQSKLKQFEEDYCGL